MFWGSEPPTDTGRRYSDCMVGEAFEPPILRFQGCLCAYSPHMNSGKRRLVVQVRGISPRGLTCRHARGLHLHSALAVTGSHGNGRKPGRNAEERRKVFLRRSLTCVVLMPPVGCHRWCFPGCGCCARCAAVRQGSRSLPGLQCVPAVPALAVSGARLPRRPCGSVLVLPGSADETAVAASRACRPCRHPPSSVPAWSGSCQSWASPPRNDSQEWTSPPFRCSQIRLGTQRYAPGITPGNITV
jgi:hypothetical protein